MGFNTILAPIISIKKNPYELYQFRRNKIKVSLPVFMRYHMIPIPTSIQAHKKKQSHFQILKNPNPYNPSMSNLTNDQDTKGCKRYGEIINTGLVCTYNPL